MEERGHLRRPFGTDPPPERPSSGLAGEVAQGGFVPRIGYRRRRVEELEQLVEAEELNVSVAYRTRSRSRYSTAARISRAFHAVQSSLCGNP